MMMDQMASCSGWLMFAGSIVTYTVLALVGAAAVKYLFAPRRPTSAA
jgi:hypothetical protein